MTDPMQTDLPNCPECSGSGKDGTPEGFACFPCNGTGKNLGVDPAPVAWAVFTPNGNIRMWSADSEYVRKFAERHGVPMTPLYRAADDSASELRSLRDALALAKSRIAELEGTGDLPVKWVGGDGTSHEISIDYAAQIAKWMFNHHGDVAQVDAALGARRTYG